MHDGEVCMNVKIVAVSCYLRFLLLLLLFVFVEIFYSYLYCILVQCNVGIGHGSEHISHEIFITLQYQKKGRNDGRHTR